LTDLCTIITVATPFVCIFFTFAFFIAWWLRNKATSTISCVYASSWILLSIFFVCLSSYRGHVCKRSSMYFDPQLVRAISHAFTAANISWHISEGTLLGMARHGGYIPWESDFDIQYDLADSRTKMPVLLQEVSQQGLTWEGKRRLRFSGAHAYCDLAPFTITKNRNQQDLQNRVFAADIIYPIQPCEFSELKVFCPHKPHELLRMEYGPEYLRPNLSRWAKMISDMLGGIIAPPLVEGLCQVLGVP